MTVVAALATAGAAPGQDLPRALSDADLRTRAPVPLATVAVPVPPNLSEFVRNKKAAVALGKALFWEQRVGSAGLACASCHFQAGADPRSKNQLTPGLAGTGTFEATGGGGRGGPNYQLTAADFPFHRKVDPTLNDRTPDNTLFDTDDATASMGALLSDFLGVGSDGRNNYVPLERAVADPVFNVAGVTVRRVEPRNTPTVINAVFNHRNFWDGRANFVFNGLDPFGQRSNAANPSQGVWVKENAALFKRQVEIPLASLASQAVGPPLSEFEMTARGKAFPHIGRLLARHYALSLQEVHPEDGVLAPFRHPSRPGLAITYAALIQSAFQPRYWSARELIATPDGDFSQLELNFSLFFGLAIQCYESTLVTPRSRFDDFVAGDDAALTADEKFGFEVFVTAGRCTICHTGPLFSNAVVPRILGRADGVGSLVSVRDSVASDVGYSNVGARRTTDDVGAGGLDPFGNPLTFSAQLSSGVLADRFLGVEPGTTSSPVAVGGAVRVRGAFKVPSLRNVELTAPYMHHGGMLTLEQVVEFYARGGDFPAANGADFTGAIRPIPELVGQPARIAAVAAFLRALTDPAVVDERAPFDHPALTVPNGHRGDEVAAASEEELLAIPAVGRRGRAAYGLPPLRKFLEGGAP